MGARGIHGTSREDRRHPERDQATRQTGSAGESPPRPVAETSGAKLLAVAAGWQESIEAVNTVVSTLAQPINETARVIGAVGKGDLWQRMPVDCECLPLKGEFLSTAQVVNKRKLVLEARGEIAELAESSSTMIDTLAHFADRVTAVAREV